MSTTSAVITSTAAIASTTVSGSTIPHTGAALLMGTAAQRTDSAARRAAIRYPIGNKVRATRSAGKAAISEVIIAVESVTGAVWVIAAVSAIAVALAIAAVSVIAEV